MSYEVTLYNSMDRPFDWYDPVEDVIETENHIDIIHENGSIYHVSKSARDYHHFEMKEI